jgi:GT2 family glycosyltransferase
MVAEPCDVSVVFVFRERLAQTMACLTHLIAHTDYPHRLICVDAGSPEPIARELAQLAEQHDFMLLRTDEQLTPNESRNLGMAHVATPYVVFIDNDVTVGDNWLEPLVRCARETGAWLVGPLYLESIRGQSYVHMFGGKVSVRDERKRARYLEKHDFAHQPVAALGAARQRRPTDLLEFHALLVDRRVFTELGPLDEGLMNSSEHADLCLTVAAAGKPIFLEPASVINYGVPDELAPEEHDFFALRWSEAWTRASVERLAEKYAIPPHERGLRKLSRWHTRHRQKVLLRCPRIERLFGKTLHRWLAHNPLRRWLECRHNRRLFDSVRAPGGRRVQARQVHG